MPGTPVLVNFVRASLCDIFDDRKEKTIIVRSDPSPLLLRNQKLIFDSAQVE